MANIGYSVKSVVDRSFGDVYLAKNIKTGEVNIVYLYLNWLIVCIEILQSHYMSEFMGLFIGYGTSLSTIQNIQVSNVLAQVFAFFACFYAGYI